MERPDDLVRVVSWNLHGWRDDPAAILRVLTLLGPDVVCLQEVYRGPGPLPWGRGTRYRLDRLARGCGLRLVTGGWAAGGNAVLAGPGARVERARSLRIPTPRFGPPRTRSWSRGRELPVLRVGERRGVALARLLLPGGRLVAAAVHLDLDPGERVRQAEGIVRLVRGFTVPPEPVPAASPPATSTPTATAPVTSAPAASASSASAPEGGARSAGTPSAAVVAGDLNEFPDGPGWRALAALVTDPAPGGADTYSAVHPHQRIDAVLVSPGVRVVRYAVGDPQADPEDLRRASDHLPVVADLALPGR